mgnify:CR=1 FL=1
MRITNQTLLRGYNRNINRIAAQKTNCMQKIWSGREFSRASEAPLSAAKALNVRRQLYNTEQYKENLKTANKFYTEAETSLLQVSDDLALVRETIIAAVNTYKDRGDLSIYAQQLETKAKSLVSIFNTDSAGRVIYGGSNNDQMPFDILEDKDGNAVTVTYNGVPINAYTDPKKFPCSDDVYIDIGLGMVINQETQKVDPQSVLKISFNGAEVAGCGAERGFVDIDIDSLQPQKRYALDVYANNIKKTVYVTCGTSADKTDLMNDINEKIVEAFKYEDVEFSIDNQTGVITTKNGTVCMVNNPNADPSKYSKLEATNEIGYTNNYKANLVGLEEGKDYSFSVEVNGEKKVISFTASKVLKENVATINDLLAKEFTGDAVPRMSEDGVVTAEGYEVRLRDAGSFVNKTVGLDPDALVKAAEDADAAGNTVTSKFKLTIDGNEHEITFTNALTKEGNIQAIQDELDKLNIDGLQIASDGSITLNGEKVAVSSDDPNVKLLTEAQSTTELKTERERTFSNNYIQLTLDAAKALRNGDIEYANGCIDRIVNAGENLLIKIADMGCSEDFIDFNLERLEVRDTNLKERQDDLEAVDPEYQITLLKQFEAIYNACLQMSSMTIGNSIFNYI